MTISNVQAALANDVVTKNDVATVEFDGVSTVTSQLSWSGSQPALATYTFSIPAGDTSGSAISFFTTSRSGLQGTPITGEIVAYDATKVIISVIPAGGTTPIFYMVATPPSDAAGGITLGRPVKTAGNYPITDFGTTGAFYTAPSPVCFVEGTAIRTARGDVMVEALVPGDRVHVLDGGPEATREVIWIGRREVDLNSHLDPFRAQPIRIRRDAFAPDMPSRDLLVSPDHAVFVDDVLIPARLLVNGASIVRETRMSKVRYFHVELEQHSVIFSENLPTESYLDTGNRCFFQNGGKVVELNPDFSTIHPCVAREMYSCAPFVDNAELVMPVWERLACRAGQLGYHAPAFETTADPAIRVVINGSEFRPVCVSGGVWSFMLPSGPHELRLLSRTARPCGVRPWIEDQRLLGVSVSRIRLRHGARVIDLALDDPGLGRGWWAVEGEGSRMWRWTNGDAVLRLPEAAGSTRLLQLTAGGGMTYQLGQTAGSLSEAFAATA